VPSQSLVDAIKVPKNFDIDDISISHDSDYATGAANEEQLSNILQGVIDDLMEKTNNKVGTDDL
jgi:hypothetical protein